MLGMGHVSTALVGGRFLCCGSLNGLQVDLSNSYLMHVKADSAHFGSVPKPRAPERGMDYGVSARHSIEDKYQIRSYLNQITMA